MAQIPTSIIRTRPHPSTYPHELRELVEPLYAEVDSIVSSLVELRDVVNSNIEFGDPESAQSNVRGVWVRQEFIATNTATTVTHNLGVPLVAANIPNVEWLVFRMRHSGAGAGAATTSTVLFVDGDVVTADTIQLRLFSGLTIAGNPLAVDFFFVPGQGV